MSNPINYSKTTRGQAMQPATPFVRFEAQHKKGVPLGTSKLDRSDLLKEAAQ